MLTKHFDLTQVCILLFSNIVRGNGGDGTYSVIRYYAYEFMFLPFSNTICIRLWLGLEPRPLPNPFYKALLAIGLPYLPLIISKVFFSSNLGL